MFRTVSLTFVSLSLIACAAKPATAPTAPPKAPENIACQQLKAADPNAACVPMRTGVQGLPDLVLADVGGGLLVRCAAGGTCNVIADLRPKQEAPKQEAPAAQAAPATSAPAAPAPAPPPKQEPKKKP